MSNLTNLTKAQLITQIEDLKSAMADLIKKHGSDEAYRNFYKTIANSRGNTIAELKVEIILLKKKIKDDAELINNIDEYFEQEEQYEKTKPSLLRLIDGDKI